MLPRNRRVIQTGHLLENMIRIRRAVPANVRIMAVVKADGYGHGAVEASKAALDGGADCLAVASVAEGAVLRRAGIQAPVLVLGAVTAGDVTEGIDQGLIQTVCSPEMVALCEKAAASLQKQAEVHLKVDTGMGRIGVRNREELAAVTHAVQQSAHVRLTGVFTHFSDADDGEDGMRYTEAQYQRFIALTEELPKEIIRHCSNSASYYGYPPVPERNLDLQPCMRWTAKISFIKDVQAGEFISYGRTYRTEKPMRVAVVTCGYADGYHRNASGKAAVLIHGKRAKILGRICMDQMMADVTDIPEAAPEDEVVLMGTDGTDRIDAEEIAAWSDTISYEILLSVGSRVERVYEGRRNHMEGNGE